MLQERDRTQFNHGKTERELGIRFRPVEETLRDTINWYRENGWLEQCTLNKFPIGQAGKAALTKTASTPRDTGNGPEEKTALGPRADSKVQLGATVARNGAYSKS